MPQAIYDFFKFQFIAFTVLEPLAALNVIQSNNELKISWKVSEMQPISFDNFNVGVSFSLFLSFFPMFYFFSFFKINFCHFLSNPVGICMFKVNSINTRTSCEICSKLTIKTPDTVVLVSLLLTLNIFQTLF